MRRRETYPCASLESFPKVLSVIEEEFVQRSKASEYGITSDEVRLAEILNFIKGIGKTTKRYQLTPLGKKLLSLPPHRQKIKLFQSLVKQNKILPPYFKKLLERTELHGKKLSTNELCENLNMKDLWSADILNEWCRYLGISEGTTKTEVYISPRKVASIRKEAFALAIQEEYAHFAGSSGLVPVAKLRQVLKNSGILGPQDDFDEYLKELSESELNKSKITYHPAPSRLVGRGLAGKTGCELIAINGKVSF